MEPVTNPNVAPVVKVGEVPNTKLPEPVSSVTAVIKFALEGVANQAAMPVPSPVTPVEMGRPVALVSVPEDGVPSAPPLTKMVELAGMVLPLMEVAVATPKTGVTKVGEVARTPLPVPVTASPWMVVADAHCASCPLVGVATFETLPPPAGVPQLALPFARMPSANCPPEHAVGRAASAPAVVEVAALPVVD